MHSEKDAEDAPTIVLTLSEARRLNYELAMARDHLVATTCPQGKMALENAVDVLSGAIRRNAHRVRRERLTRPDLDKYQAELDRLAEKQPAIWPPPLCKENDNDDVR